MYLNSGLSYNEFLQYATTDQLDMIRKQNEFSKLHNKGLNEIKNIEEVVNILVFSEARCKDAATVIPILLNIKELNNNINIKFFKADAYKEELEKNNLGSRIPTIVKLDNKGELVDFYSEFPKCVKDKFKDKKKEDIIKEFREGRYSKEIQEELINLIVGK